VRRVIGAAAAKQQLMMSLVREEIKRVQGSGRQRDADETKRPRDPANGRQAFEAQQNSDDPKTGKKSNFGHTPSPTLLTQFRQFELEPRRQTAARILGRSRCRSSLVGLKPDA